MEEKVELALLLESAVLDAGFPADMQQMCASGVRARLGATAWSVRGDIAPASKVEVGVNVVALPTSSVAVRYLCSDLCSPVAVTVGGSLDEWALMVLSRNIRSALRRRPALVLLGLSRVVSVTEPVLPALLCVSHTVALCDGQMRTIAPPGVSARHAIVNAGLADRLALRPTLESALAG